MLARVLLMTLLATEPPSEEPLAHCEDLSELRVFDEDSVLRHPYWRGWFAGARRTDGTWNSQDESFTLVHALPGRAPRFRAPLALPPPLTGEVTMRLSPAVRKRKGRVCTSVGLSMDSDGSTLRQLAMDENPPLELHARVMNAGQPVLDVTWEARELLYSEDYPPGARILSVSSPPTARSGGQSSTRILLGGASEATALIERRSGLSTVAEDSDFGPVRGEFISSLLELGLTWEKVLRSRPPERVSPAWRQLLLELIAVDLNAPPHPGEPRRAEWARRLEALGAVKVDSGAEPLWEPLRRAWLARLRPPAPSGPAIGQAELSIAPVRKGLPPDGLEEVWLDGRRILCPGCSQAAFKGVTTRTVDVPPERAVRLWMRWRDRFGASEREDWVPLLPGGRYQLRYDYYFNSASDQGTTVTVIPESGARGTQPACVTVDAEAGAAPGLGWSVRPAWRSPEPPPVSRVSFGTLQPAVADQTLAIVPAQGDMERTYGLWPLPLVQYLHAGTYRFVLEKDGDVRLRFSPDVGECGSVTR